MLSLMVVSTGVKRSCLLNFNKLLAASRLLNSPALKVRRALSFTALPGDVLQCRRFIFMSSCDLQKIPQDTSRVSPNEATQAEEKPSTSKMSMKQAVRDYGATVIVFHACLSILSFGVSYAVVSSGLDVISWLEWMGLDRSIIESRFAAGASTVVISYAVYKVFSPLRVACTLTVTPFIVRYLRRIGFIKTPGSQ